VLLGAFSGLIWWQTLATSERSQANVDVLAPVLTSNEPAARQAVMRTPPDGYVGSGACAKCHPTIAEMYAKHPMSRSAGLVAGVPSVEAFDDRTHFRPHGNCRYWVERAENQVIHHEIMVDALGETIYDDAQPIDLFIGSGTRGKTYAIFRGRHLFESPISWFTGDGGKWDLSPGYAPTKHKRFERLVGDECMMCHAGQMAGKPGDEDTFRNPLFVEAGIGCERCHGPGERHVAWQEGAGRGAGAARDGDDHEIVNPASLDPARRESICNQCHLLGKLSVPRYGRSFFDFRPGQLLDDFWTVMVEGTVVHGDGMITAVGQVQQMRDSACYRGSEGRLGCSSCHDPHAAPEPSAAAKFYRGRCLECHSQHGCSLPEAQRAAPPGENSCIACHMPRLNARDVAHAAQTDHRVQRVPRAETGSSSDGPEGKWDFFDHAEQRMERWEVDRVKGIAEVMLAQQFPLSAATRTRAAEALLRSAFHAAPDDVPVLEALAYAAAKQGRTAEARDFLERALQAEPHDEKALQFLVAICLQTGDVEGGIRHGERLLDLNPWPAANYVMLWELFSQTGQLGRAIELAEDALKHDPTLPAPRSWLVRTYRQAGDQAASRRHADILDRMDEAD
jgi:hypothetical protein